MAWDVEFTDVFGGWWKSLDDDEREDVAYAVRILEERGPLLGRPHVDSVKQSRHSNMKELRIQHEERPYRVLFAFDPRRAAILLIGGNKTASARWYEEYVPKADGIYEKHLSELRKEGRI